MTLAAQLGLGRVVAMMAAIGGALVFAGLMFPVHSVGSYVAEQAFMAWCTPGDDGTHRPSPEGGEAYRALFTHRYLLIDIGVGVLSVAAAVLALTALFPAARQGRSPERLWHFFAIGIVGICWLFAGVAYAIFIDFGRRLLPWCADSIGIPLLGLLFLFPILLLICLVGGLAVSTMFRSLNVPLTVRGKREGVVALLANALATLLLAVGLIVAAAMVTTAESAALGAIVLFAYLVLSARANIVAARVPED